jgi:hypothetical protein
MSINIFGVIWAGFLGMLAGIIGGVLVAIPIYFLVLSSVNRHDCEPHEEALRVVFRVVSLIVLGGFIFSALNELGIQEKSQKKSPSSLMRINLYGFLPTSKLVNSQAIINGIKIYVAPTIDSQ